MRLIFLMPFCFVSEKPETRLCVLKAILSMFILSANIMGICCMTDTVAGIGLARRAVTEERMGFWGEQQWEIDSKPAQPTRDSMFLIFLSALYSSLYLS